MKKYTILALVLVLCLSLFTGCRNRNPVNNPTMPESRETTAPTTAATTAATTHPTTEATRETNTQAATDRTEGMTDHNGNAGQETETQGDMEGRARRVIPGHQ